MTTFTKIWKKNTWYGHTYAFILEYKVALLNSPKHKVLNKGKNQKLYNTQNIYI